jgi:hypothetical protein
MSHVASCVKIVSELIYRKKGATVVLVSLARAGTPVGVLVKRCMEILFGVIVEHYTVSIVRGKGIDKAAMKYILDRHSAHDIQFVDGWTGKGTIQDELTEAVKDYPGVSPSIACLYDPAGVADISGRPAGYDGLVPTCVLNASVCGLMSRTVCLDDDESHFHGAVLYNDMKDSDDTNKFLHVIDWCIRGWPWAHADDLFLHKVIEKKPQGLGVVEAEEIAKAFDSKLEFVKPGIGETTRVLLRRVPKHILVSNTAPESDVKHIYELAKERGIEVQKYPLRNYAAVGIVKEMSDA